MANSKYSNTYKVLLLLLINILTTNVLALNSDLRKAATITADAVEYNHKTGISTYSGHIHAKQGTTQLDANRVVVHRGNQNKITKIVAEGKLAHYETLPDGQENKIHAHAKTIEYYPLEEKIVLKGDAIVEFDKSHIAGQHITYNMVSQTAISKPSREGKTTIILQPQVTAPTQTAAISPKSLRSQREIQTNKPQRKNL